MKIINFHIDKALLEQLTAYAKKNNLSVSAAIRSILYAFFRKADKMDFAHLKNTILRSQNKEKIHLFIHWLLGVHPAVSSTGDWYLDAQLRELSEPELRKIHLYIHKKLKLRFYIHGKQEYCKTIAKLPP